MATKTCTRCGEEKDLDKFSKFKNSKDGLRPWCKPCCAAYRKENAVRIAQQEKEYREKNADKYKQWQQQYYAQNGDKIREYSKMYRAAMSDEQKEETQKKNIEYCRQYYQENKDKINAANKQYAIEHADQIREAAKKYREENKDKLNEKQRERNKIRRETDPQYKLTRNIRNLVWDAIAKESKHGRSLELLGCTIPELKAHLESQFDANMTWENHGTYWHIDHIIPVCFFDMTNEIEQKRCFHWSNLQPLEAIANMKKSGSLAAVLPIENDLLD